MASGNVLRELSLEPSCTRSSRRGGNTPPGSRLRRSSGDRVPDILPLHQSCPASRVAVSKASFLGPVASAPFSFVHEHDYPLRARTVRCQGVASVRAVFLSEIFDARHPSPSARHGVQPIPEIHIHVLAPPMLKSNQPEAPRASTARSNPADDVQSSTPNQPDVKRSPPREPRLCERGIEQMRGGPAPLH